MDFKIQISNTSVYNDNALKLKTRLTTDSFIRLVKIYMNRMTSTLYDYDDDDDYYDLERAHCLHS